MKATIASLANLPKPKPQSVHQEHSQNANISESTAAMFQRRAHEAFKFGGEAVQWQSRRVARILGML